MDASRVWRERLKSRLQRHAVLLRGQNGDAAATVGIEENCHPEGAHARDLIAHDCTGATEGSCTTHRDPGLRRPDLAFSSGRQDPSVGAGESATGWTERRLPQDDGVQGEGRQSAQADFVWTLRRIHSLWPGVRPSRLVLAAALLAALAAAPALVSSPALVSPPVQEPAQAAATPAAPDAFVWATARYESGDWNSAPLVPTNLQHSIAQYTSLPVASTGVIVDLSSAELFKFPFVYLTGHLPVRFNGQESANLKAFVERGGFIFIDDHNHDVDGGFHKTATAEIARIFGSGALKPIPKNHELYRAFFVFDDGPPTTSHELNGWGDNLVHENLFGVEVNGRLGVLYSNKDYSSEWNYHARSKRQQSIDNTRFGVNVAVYALTR
jgi:hypothetical protein